jgi:hypothetical protein
MGTAGCPRLYSGRYRHLFRVGIRRSRVSAIKSEKLTTECVNYTAESRYIDYFLSLFHNEGGIGYLRQPPLPASRVITDTGLCRISRQIEHSRAF